MSKMFLMCGICGSGKSYWAKKFAKEHNYYYLNVDDYYAIVNGSEKIHENKFEVWQLFFKDIYNAYKQGLSIVIDTNAPYIFDRQEFLNWFSDFNEHHLIWIKASLDLAWKNNINRDRKISPEGFHYNVINFTEPTPQEPGGRANWDSIVCIENVDNIFQKAEIIKSAVKGKDWYNE